MVQSTMSMIMYSCKLRHPWTTFCLLCFILVAAIDWTLLTLNIVPLAQCIFLMLCVKKDVLCLGF